MKPRDALDRGSGGGVNDDPADNEALQWFGTMSVAPNGRIGAIWNDNRRDPGTPCPRSSTLANAKGPRRNDVDGDGRDDLLAHFRTEESGIAFGDTSACVTGQLLAGTLFEGCDDIRTVPAPGGGV